MFRFLLATTAVTGFGLAGHFASLDSSHASDLPQVQDEYHFRESLDRGERLTISNIQGTVIVTQGTGRTADITVRKRTNRGDGDRVLAILERTDEGIHVCTVYRDSASDTPRRCHKRNRSWDGGRSPDVDMTYTVSLPAGVRLEAATVSGDLSVSGLDTPSELHTVSGDVTYRGVMPIDVGTVSGDLDLIISGDVRRSAEIATVNGNIMLQVGDNVSFDVEATNVSGKMESDFPITIEGKWGPRSMQGSINGGGPEVELSSVNGRIQVRRAR